MEGKVVVVSPLTVLEHKETGIFAASFLELGLTSYGYTASDAEQSAKRLFNTFIHTYRQEGRLAGRLDQLQVKWWWESDYTKPYEDTDRLAQGWLPANPSAAAPITLQANSQAAESETVFMLMAA